MTRKVVAVSLIVVVAILLLVGIGLGIYHKTTAVPTGMVEISPNGIPLEKNTVVADLIGAWKSPDALPSWLIILEQNGFAKVSRHGGNIEQWVWEGNGGQIKLRVNVNATEFYEGRLEEDHRTLSLLPPGEREVILLKQ